MEDETELEEVDEDRFLEDDNDEGLLEENQIFAEEEETDEIDDSEISELDTESRESEEEQNKKKKPNRIDQLKMQRKEIDDLKVQIEELVAIVNEKERKIQELSNPNTEGIDKSNVAEFFELKYKEMETLYKDRENKLQLIEAIRKRVSEKEKLLDENKKDLINEIRNM